MEGFNYSEALIVETTFVINNYGIDILKDGDKFTYQMFLYHPSSYYNPEDYELIEHDFKFFDTMGDTYKVGRAHVRKYYNDNVLG